MTENRLKNFNVWIDAVRLNTLPLSLSGTTLGSFLASADGSFSWSVLILASLTSVLLQIISNLANDYGDYVNGKDTAARIGPVRMVQSGQIPPRQMAIAVMVLVVLTFIVGAALVLAGTINDSPVSTFCFILMGIAAIVASVKYTIGKNPYGYQGLGDVFVFIFFGLMGTIGTFYLHTHRLRIDLVLPASSIGLLSTGVLNLNNLRDEQTDRKAQKRTFVIIIGNDRAKTYHTFLIVAAVIAGIAYTLLNFRSGFQFLFLLLVPGLFQNIRIVFRHTRPEELNTELRNLSLSTLLFAVAFGAGLLIP